MITILTWCEVIISGQEKVLYFTIGRLTRAKKLWDSRKKWRETEQRNHQFVSFDLLVLGRTLKDFSWSVDWCVPVLDIHLSYIRLKFGSFLPPPPVGPAFTLHRTYIRPTEDLHLTLAYPKILKGMLWLLLQQSWFVFVFLLYWPEMIFFPMNTGWHSSRLIKAY